jgi:poly(A) polymerase/tRNA nucleotidyltransferase (CCA-adding enzyme)
MSAQIPKEVCGVARALEGAGFEAYLVGGCVRDLLLDRDPKDWDIATNATPEEIQKLFPDSVYENDFGTVLVKLKPQIDADNKRKGAEEPEALRSSAYHLRNSASIIEVTTYRIEGRYTDKRHPDEIKFAKTIEEDLSRRDFTVNALALSVVEGMATNLVDPFGGRQDLTSRIIRAVGKAEERFNEDALRLLRAVRLATELDFQIEFETRRAIEKHAGLLEMIAKERIRDEFEKLIMAPRAAAGVIMLEDLDLLRYVLPELREGLGVEQNLHHIYTVFEHSVRCLDYAAKQNYSLAVRLGALLHDIGKPRSKAGEGRNSTFYAHERIGAKMAAAALGRLRFSKELIEEVAHLVRYHMFYYNVGEVSDAGVRRFLRRVGPETVPDLIKIREADRIGSGTPKAVPYKLRHFLFMIEKVKNDPISPKMLKVSGEDVMRVAELPPGPKVGQLLAVLLEEILDDPVKNERERLESRIRELAARSERELAAMAAKAKETKEEFESGVEEQMKKRHHVQ